MQRSTWSRNRLLLLLFPILRRPPPPHIVLNDVPWGVRSAVIDSARRPPSEMASDADDDARSHLTVDHRQSSGTYLYVFLCRKHETHTTIMTTMSPMAPAPTLITSRAVEIYITPVCMRSTSPLSTEVSTGRWCAHHFRSRGSSSSE
jgi:hypothetical protein